MKYRPEYDPKVIGKNLKHLRLANKLSVKEVQKYLRLGTPQAYYKYEKGSGYPQSDTLLALMELYNAELHDIIDDHAALQENAVQEVKAQDIPEATAEVPVKNSICAFETAEQDAGEEPLHLSVESSQNSKCWPEMELAAFCEGKVVSITKIISIDEHKERQAKHLMKYYTLWQEYCKNHRAG